MPSFPASVKESEGHNNILYTWEEPPVQEANSVCVLHNKFVALSQSITHEIAPF